MTRFTTASDFNFVERLSQQYPQACLEVDLLRRRQQQQQEAGLILKPI